MSIGGANLFGNWRTDETNLYLMTQFFLSTIDSEKSFKSLFAWERLNRRYQIQLRFKGWEIAKIIEYLDSLRILKATIF